MFSRIYSLCFYVAIGICLLSIGCAAIFQPLPTRIEAALLSCEEYPSLVDDDLSTISNLKVKSYVKKDQANYRGSTQIGDWLEGKDRAEALIQLNSLTQVAFIEVHPISNIYRLSVDISAAEMEHQKAHQFEPVKSHKIVRSRNGEVIRFNIDRPARILKVVVFVNRDSAHVTQEPVSNKTNVSFDDVMIREIKVYSDDNAM